MAKSFYSLSLLLLSLLLKIKYNKLENQWHKLPVSVDGFLWLEEEIQLHVYKDQRPCDPLHLLGIHSERN